MTAHLDTTHRPTAPRPAFGSDGFMAAYGAAWGDVEVLLGFFSADIRYRDIVSGVELRGLEVMRRFMKVYATFSPDCVVDFTRVVYGDRSVAAEWTWRGTGVGALRMPDGVTDPSGRRFDVPGMSFCTVDADGLIDSHTDYWDGGTLLRQLHG